MSVWKNTIPILSGIVFCLLFSSACVSTTIGDAVYSQNNITLSLSHDGEPSEGYVQVTIYEIENNQQRESDVLFADVSLHRGGNTAIIPVTLEPGQYKLYIYLIQDGERKTAAIRDLVVN